MSKKIIHEAEIDIGKLVKLATAAGVSAYAIKEIIKKYKKNKQLKRLGITGKRSEEQESLEIMRDLADAYSLRAKNKGRK